MNIVLIGLPASGKTLVGKLLAVKLKKDYVDTDDLILQLARDVEPSLASVQEVYQKFGENYFRQLETRVIKELVVSKHGIISLGGGSLLKTEHLTVLKPVSFFVYLKVPLNILENRLEKMSPRPLFAHKPLSVRLQELLEEREPIFKSVANLIIDAASEAESIVEMLCKFFQSRQLPEI